MDHSKGCCARACEKAFPSGYKDEFKGTMKIAWAIVLTQVAEMYFQPIAVMFGGHLGKLELDAIALSNTLINVLGYSIIIGMATCCETVFSQCYGFGHHKMIGIYLQRSLYIHLLALFPCFAIHLNLEPILVAIGQDPEVSKLTTTYLLYFMPGMVCLCLTIILRRYTQCQSIVIPHIFILGTAHALHAVCQYLLLYQFDMGIIGSAIAQDITFFFVLVVTCIYTHFSQVHKESWGGWDWRGLSDWGPLARLAIYGMLMVGFEWWAFEISIILSGYIGTTELGAQCVAFNLDAMYYGFVYGIGIATCIRTGQFVGAGMPLNAKTTSRVGMTITGVMGLMSGTIFAVLRYQLPRIFTDDEDVINMVANILPVLGLYAMASGLNVIGRGVFRGIGWQRAGSILSFIAFYVFAWPIAIPLTFYTNLGIVGLWMGFMIALFISGLFYVVVVLFKLDWDSIAGQAVSRARYNRTISCSQASVEDEVYKSTESTPLLMSQGSPSHSPSMESKLSEQITSETERSYKPLQITAGLLIKRGLTVFIFLAILGVGLFVRLYLDYHWVAPTSGYVGANGTLSGGVSNWTSTVTSYPVTAQPPGSQSPGL